MARTDTADLRNSNFMITREVWSMGADGVNCNVTNLNTLRVSLEALATERDRQNTGTWKILSIYLKAKMSSVSLLGISQLLQIQYILDLLKAFGFLISTKLRSIT